MSRNRRGGGSMSEPDRYRPERGGGLDIGLALLLGIELAKESCRLDQWGARPRGSGPSWATCT